jgi:hypothetical protein
MEVITMVGVNREHKRTTSFGGSWLVYPTGFLHNALDVDIYFL